MLIKEKVNNHLNVCLLNDSFPPVIDGVANAVLNYARVIHGSFGSSVVVTPYYPGAADEYPFPVIRYPSVKAPKAAGYRVGIPVYKAVREIKKYDINIIHSHCPFVSALASKALRASVKAPVVMTYHTKFDIDIANTFDSELMQSMATRFIVSNIEACDEVWVVSDGAGENLRSLGYRGSYRKMVNGADFPKKRAPLEEIRKISDLHGLYGEEPVFLFVGRMMWYKGIRIILDGLCRAKAAGMRFRMIFVGDGADRGEITAYARSLGLARECIFTGAINDREKLRAYYSRADAFLFPSVFDTSGLVVTEAAACGLASVLVRASAAAEGVTDGRNGVLIEEDAACLASVLMALTKNREGLREIGRRASEELYLSWDASVSRACERYRELLEDYRSGRGVRRGA